MIPKNSHNRLLAALPRTAFRRLAPELELVELEPGAILYAPGDKLQHAYFPIDCIVSLLCVLEDESTAEIAVIGNDGMVGVTLFLGGVSTPSFAVVQNAGSAYRLPARTLAREFFGGVVQRLFLRYTQALIMQMTQTAVCNRHHCVDQQLCRWLLLSLDLSPGNEISVTQDLIASLLGVRREGVCDAARKLKANGIIHWGRGHLTVLDRPQLEASVCECYAIVKKETKRLLPALRFK